MRGCFVSATGTGVGKTVFARTLTWALRDAGHRVAALKPLETGFADAEASDAAALARAAGLPDLAWAPGLYRAAPPLAPAAAARQGGAVPPSPAALARALRDAAADHDVAVIEGAGGLLVPLDREHTVADLVAALDLPLVLLATDALGVLSHVLTAFESAERRGLEVNSVVLVEPGPDAADPSNATNAELLRERLPCAVRLFGRTATDDASLRAHARRHPWLLELPRTR